MPSKNKVKKFSQNLRVLHIVLLYIYGLNLVCEEGIKYRNEFREET